MPEIELLWGLGIDAWITIATVIAVIGVMLLTKVRIDAVMLIAIGVLFVTGVLDAKEMCMGFSSSTVVVTGVLGVVMAGLRYTGVLQWMMKHVFGLPKRYPTALLRMMVPVSMLSAFISNTMLTMLFGNVLKRWSRKLSIAPSKLYLPMVYAVQMGGVFHVKGGNLIDIHHFDHDPSILSEDEYVMGGAIAKTGIAQKIALGVISMVGTQPILIMLGVCLAATALPTICASVSL